MIKKLELKKEIIAAPNRPHPMNLITPKEKYHWDVFIRKTNVNGCGKQAYHHGVLKLNNER